MPGHHVVFLVSLVVVAPAVAIAGVSAGGDWRPFGVGVATALVASTAARSAAVLRQQPRGPLQLRMLGLTITVALVATVLALGALACLGIELVR